MRDLQSCRRIKQHRVMVKLNDCGVRFDKKEHKYDLNGRILGGVTPIVKWIYPDTYKDIPEEVLNKAAEYGTMVHSQCELADSLGIVDSEQARQYIVLKESVGLQTIVSEYLVTDGVAIASGIDKVMMEKDGDESVCPLVDLKATSQIHIPNVRLQLSIYAYLFEKVNPHLKAGRLFAFWLPKPQYGYPKVFEVQRISSGLIEEILDSYLKDGNPSRYAEIIAQEVGSKDENEKTAEAEEKEEIIPDEMVEVTDELSNIKKTMDELKAREDELKAFLLQKMKEGGVRKWSGDDVVISKVEATVRESVDSAKLKKMHPDVYLECKKISKVSESIRIKFQ